ncbi:MAG: hypothetical protein A2Y81_05505 [Nitrospirae bacterium RBG_13_43_8]|nr:MAG: hypothetical protein A2Y81_05505 [Nitrospirae bacterium RBG_13_43_8]
MQKKEIFISYHNSDKDFALYFAKWLTSNFTDIEVFSTSHPMSIEPGRPWFNEIVKAATSVDMILLLIGPDSIDYRWMLFEAGLSAAKEKCKIVPIIFGGVTVEDVKLPLTFYQILKMDHKERFNAFFQSDSFTPKNKSADFYDSFCEEDPLMDWYVKYGSYSRFYRNKLKQSAEITTVSEVLELSNIGSSISEVRWVKTNEHEILRHPIEHPKMKRRDGQPKVLTSVRLAMMPIRCESETTWKAGIAFYPLSEPFASKNHNFVLHSGNHSGLSSWSLYWKDGDKYVPINIPATLDFEAYHHMNIWFNRERNELLAYAIDSDRNRCVFTINGREKVWNPNLINAGVIEIKGWIDEPSRQLFRIKTVYELDYC